MKKNLLKIVLGAALITTAASSAQGSFSNITTPAGNVLPLPDPGQPLVGGETVVFDYSIPMPATPGIAKLFFKLKRNGAGTNQPNDNLSNGYISGGGGTTAPGSGPLVIDIPAGTAPGTLLSYTGLELRLIAIPESESATGAPSVTAANYDDGFDGEKEGIEALFFDANNGYVDYGGATFYGSYAIDFTANDPLSTNSNESITSKLSPNPTSDVLRLDDSVEYKSVSVYDMVGKKVMQVAKSSELNVSALDKGVYVLVTDTNLKGKFVKN